MEISWKARRQLLMINSMTGFGRYESITEEYRISVEIKAVNHRYLDLGIKMPKKLNGFEAAMRTLLKDYIQRGKVDVFITYESYTEANLGLRYNSVLAGEYVERGWAMQLHCGCRRDNNRRMFSRLGPDTGYDCISNYSPAGQMADFLNGLQEEGKLPRTIIYSLDPGDDELIGSLIGCFQDGSAVGKLQQGAAWWFNDHKQGMVKQMTSLANLGLLGNFIGMLTDSRSFLSYPRHEYFRRILCELIGGWVENGEYPCDEKRLERLIKGISYNNAVRYFGFDLEER